MDIFCLLESCCDLSNVIWHHQQMSHLRKKKTKKNCKTCFFIDKIDSHKTVSESVAGLMRFLNGVDIEEEQAAHFHPFKLKMLTVRGE